MTKIVVSETQEPVVLGFLQPDHYERGLDPWHKDAMPDEFKDLPNWNTGERAKGWYGVDWCGNTVLWVPDGTEMETPDEEIKS